MKADQLSTLSSQLSDVPFPMNTNANTHQSAIAVPIVAPIHLALDVER